MSDPILQAFRAQQLVAAKALAERGDILKLRSLDPGAAPSAYHVTFHCKTLVLDGTEVREADRVEVGFFIPPDYLERVDPVRTVSILNPFNIFHPNVLGPVICIGRMTPGTELTDLIYQVYEIVTFQKYATHDSLNKRAAQWCRNNHARLPLERRPLKRRSLAIEGELEQAGGVPNELGM